MRTGRGERRGPGPGNPWLRTCISRAGRTRHVATGPAAGRGSGPPSVALDTGEGAGTPMPREALQTLGHAPSRGTYVCTGGAADAGGEAPVS
jgi:hypothetical protein